MNARAIIGHVGGHPVYRIAGGDGRDEVTLDRLSGMSAAELRTAIGRLEEELAGLHMNQDGSLRDLSAAEHRDEFEPRLRLLDRAKAHLQIREAADRGTGIERAFGGRVGTVNAFDTSPAEVLRLRPGEARDKALKALETRGRGLAPEQQDQMASLLRAQITRETPNTDGEYIAKRTLITESDAYRSAFQQVMADPHPVLTAEEAGALRALRELDRQYEMRAMAEGAGATGGFGVPVFIDPTIVLTAQQPLNPIARIARNEIITTSAWKGVSSAGVTWSWDAEAAEVSDDSPTLAQPTVPVYMARGFVPYSIEVGTDYPGFAEEMATLLAEGYEDLSANAFAVGTGSGQPRGIITALDANTNTEVLLTTAGSFGGVDVNKVWKPLPDRARGRATWVMSHDVAADVAAFANAQNLASFFTVDLGGVLTTLRSRPVEPSSYFPGSVSGTSHQNQIVVGNFQRYLIARRAGMAVEPIPHLFGLTSNRPTGQRGAFAWARVGADSIADTDFRILNQT